MLINGGFSKCYTDPFIDYALYNSLWDITLHLYPIHESLKNHRQFLHQIANLKSTSNLALHFKVAAGNSPLTKIMHLSVQNFNQRNFIGGVVQEMYNGVFPKWSRTFIEFRESNNSLKHELG